MTAGSRRKPKRPRPALRVVLTGVAGAAVALAVVAVTGEVSGRPVALPSAVDARVGAPAARSTVAPGATGAPDLAAQQPAGTSGGAAATAGEQRGRTGGGSALVPGRGEPSALADHRIRLTERLLHRRAAAVVDDNRRAYLATVDPASSAFAVTARRTFTNLTGLGVTDVRFTEPTIAAGGLSPGRQRALGDPAWVAETELSFRIAGQDSQRWTAPLRLVVVERDGEPYVAADHAGTDAGVAVPLWWQQAVTAVRGRHSMVIGTGSRQRLRGYADLADRAVPRVSRVWGRDWARFVVVVVPASREQMERVLGARPGSQRQVASVTTTVGRGDPELGPYVVINPDSFSRIGSTGRLVVLTHETVHVATRATTTLVPVWLSEGFADYVGFSTSGLGPQQIGRQLLDRVRRHGPPADLPTAASFDPQAPQLERAYESAWSACRYIAKTWGQARLVAFYRAMDGAATAGSEGATYRTVLGVTSDGFLTGWRSFVEQLAAAPAASTS